MLSNQQHSFESQQYQDVVSRFVGINGVKYQECLGNNSTLVGDETDLIPSTYHASSFSSASGYNSVQPTSTSTNYPTNIYSYYYQQQHSSQVRKTHFIKHKL